MKKKIVVYSIAILLIFVVFNLAITGKVEAKTNSQGAFQITVPNAYEVYQDDASAYIVGTTDGVSGVSTECTDNTDEWTVTGQQYLDVVKSVAQQIYGSDIVITNSKLIEKEATYCPVVSFYRTGEDVTTYYEISSLKSDKHIYTVTFVSFDSNYFTSTEKNNIWKSFKIKDTVKWPYGLPFTDVPSKEWYRSAVEYVYTNNIIKGLNSYTFAPNDKLTRGMMVTILYRMAGSPKVSGTSKFNDVKNTGEWYYNAVLWAANNKIASGYDNGNFGPNDNITREQLAVFLYKYAKFRGRDVSASKALSSFKDGSKVSSFATTQMKWATAVGVITGNNNTTPPTLNPTGTATRAEAASMLYKFCTKVGK